MRCRIGSKLKPCEYTPQGISAIKLLDTNDFVSLEFKEDGLYSNNLITKIRRKGGFVEIESPITAKYTLTRQNGRYTHTLETFLEDLSYTNLADQDLASKARKYVVLFRTNVGKWFLFGYDPGASFSFSSQTEESTGSLIKLAESSEFPLFGVDANALTDLKPLATYEPSPVNSFCVQSNGGNTGILQYRYMLKVSTSGEPLDLNGELCGISGQSQAYLLLEGYPLLNGYDLEGYFKQGASISGVQSFGFNPQICPIKINNSLYISDVQVFIEVGGTKTVNLTSTSPWKVTNPIDSIASLSILSGFAGTYPIEVTGVNNGIYNFDILNTETNERVRLSVVVGSVNWVFKNGYWTNGYWIKGKKWGLD